MNYGLIEDISMVSTFGTNQQIYNSMGFCNKSVIWQPTPHDHLTILEFYYLYLSDI